LTIAWHCSRDPTFSHFSTVPACDRQTDEQTDGQTHKNYCASIVSRGTMGQLFFSTPHSGVVCHPSTTTWYSPPVHKVVRLLLQPFQWYHWCPKKF